MVIKTLGIFDILISILFFTFIVFDIKSLAGIILLSGLFLLVKGVVFIGNLNITSIFDVVNSFIIILSSSIEINIIIAIIVSLFLLQKGIFSLM